MTPPFPEAAETLTATITRVIFESDASGFCVLSVALGTGALGPFAPEAVAVGVMLSPHEGDKVKLHGSWVHDPKRGRQFKFESYEPELPRSAAGAEAYLSSGRIKGIGASTARAIVAHFGDDTLHILDEDIERLEEVPGIGAKKRETITQGWLETAQQRGIAIALASVGAPTRLAHAIWDAFGAAGAAQIRENPYALTRAKGVGFTTCDQMAARMGWDRRDERRLSAGLAHTLEEAEMSGHCYLPIPQLTKAAAELLGVSHHTCKDALALAVKEERVVVEEDRVYTARLHYLETDLAAQFLRVAEEGVVPPSASQAKAITALLSKQSLTAEQETVVQDVMHYPLTVLTGGPGVGKSHTIGAVVAAAAICRWRIVLCAPTGRAAQRMSELAGGAEAATVHRLIGYGQGKDRAPLHDLDDPLAIDLLICDETSMLDVSLARHLLRAVPTGARVLFVGDIDQLPSVGPGSVLRDLITSGRANTCALTQIFRQKADSGIVQVAHTVNAGKPPRYDGWNDLHLWRTDKPDQAAEYVEAMVCEHLPRKFDLDPADVQVLAPQKKGSCGVHTLNTRLQARINPGTGREVEVVIDKETVIFRPGDRAMVVKNNYQKGAKGVFNGTPVRISAVNPDSKEETVTIVTDEDETIHYARSELAQLSLAYAVTIHKSQGSQYPCVVVPVTMQAFKMLVRNLLYTAITRAQSRVVLIGDPKALATAVRTEDAVKRHTGLASRLAP